MACDRGGYEKTEYMREENIKEAILTIVRPKNMENYN
jgi:hypothetical protein